MCLGVPMRIVEGDAFSALCARGDEQRRVSMLLIGAQAPETFVLVHIDTAIRFLEADEARLIEDALDSLRRPEALYIASADFDAIAGS